MKTAVYLIGAGPGDPELITLKGRRCLEAADCVIYDHLVNRELLRYAPGSAERVYVGKQGGRDHIAQAEINSLLLERARQGKTVARLKGGDPFIFGRGGEEAEVLARACIPFEVVPGVSAGSAAPAYAGIPLTHRDYGPTVAFVAAQQDPTRDDSALDWKKISSAAETLVFFMGARSLRQVVEQLTRHGRSPSTPIALIRWGTRPSQEVVTATLGSILEQVAPMSPPTLIVVGEVVRLRERLRWFDNRPLFGKRILITRPRHQSRDFRRALELLGAMAISFPTVEVREPDSWAKLDRALETIDRYDWLIFTSVNGVKYFFNRYFRRHPDIRQLKGVRIAAIGPATRRAVLDFKLAVDTLPSDYQAEGLVESLRGKVVKGMRVLLPRARVAREVLPRELQRQGARVEVVEAYRTGPPENAQFRWAQVLNDAPPHMVVFTSSSTVANLADLTRPKSLAESLQGAAVACIGPITAGTARDLGLQVDLVPEKYTTASLIEAMEEYFSRKG
ncbi:MAG: uroporphyrinogen-III C-methyltransferase [Acidobacteriota bacterium]|nr:uroporphyrinogen-III C-methyltransferase [Acidobacteriota bacterium]